MNFPMSAIVTSISGIPKSPQMSPASSLIPPVAGQEATEEDAESSPGLRPRHEVPVASNHRLWGGTGRWGWNR